MPWKPLPRIAFAIAVFPFAAESPADLPLELGDELYVIEQGGAASEWYRGYLVAPPSLLSGLTSVKGQTLEARVFSGIFPRNCVEVREVLDEPEADEKVATTDFGYRPTNSKAPNGVALDSQTSPQHRKSIRRTGSQRGLTRSKWSSPIIDSPQDSGAGRLQTPSPSPGALTRIDGQGLSRKLSRRSVHSLRSQESAAHISPMSRQGLSQPLAPVPMLKIGDETPTSLLEPLVDEVASCLREWHSKDLHELLLSRRYTTLEQLADLIRQLDISRRQLLHDVLTHKELEKKREEIVWNLVRGNKLLGGEIIVRDPKQAGRLLTSSDSAVEITKLQSTMSLLDRPVVSQPEKLNLHHLLFELKEVAHCSLDSPSLSVSLYSKSPGVQAAALTETFTVDLPAREGSQLDTPFGQSRTLFTDLSTADVGLITGSGNELFIVVKLEADDPVEQSALQVSHKDDAIGSSAAPATSHESLAAPAAGSLKRGRQSLVWAQKQFGSTRRRVPPDIQAPSASHAVNPTSSSQNISRPHTPQDLTLSTPQDPQKVRRLVAVGALSLKQLMAEDSSQEQRLTMSSPSVNRVTLQGSVSLINELLNEFMPSNIGHFVQSNSLPFVDIALQSFSSPDSEELINNTPAVLQGIVPTPKSNFSGAPRNTRSDIFVNFSEAYIPPNALLSHPERGPVALPSDCDYQNMQLHLEVRKGSGQRIERCIFPKSNGIGVTCWATLAVGRGTSWDQTVKLVLSEEDVSEAHLVMSIANAPKRPFALCWIPLWEQDAFIKDGVHMPLLYLYDRVTSPGNDNYLALPWSSRSKDNTAKDETFTGPVATMKLEIRLVSTVIVQDRVLGKLLKWRDQPEDQLLTLLRQFIFVSETDIVKVASRLLDSLFGILVSKAGDDVYEDLVFDALITILGMVHDRRFFNMGPLIDEYTETQFDSPYATPCLIRSYLRLLARPTASGNSRRLHATIKVGRQVLKFITTARAQQREKERSIGLNNDMSFRREYKAIFSAFEAVIRDPSPSLVGSKTLIVQHMYSWLPTSTETFSEDEIYEIAASFVSACANVQGKLILFKLLLILRLSKRTTFTQSTVQDSFATSTTDWIAPHWGASQGQQSQWREQIRICSSIIAAQSEEFSAAVARVFTKIIDSYHWILNTRKGRNPRATLEFLFPRSYPFPSQPVSTPERFDEALMELAALLGHCPGAMLNQVLTGLGPNTAETISATLDVLSSILRKEAFPNLWISLLLYHHHVVLQTLESIHQVMAVKYLPSPDDADDFDTALWSKYFTLLIQLVGSETLTLENFAEQKRRVIWMVAKDVRAYGAHLLQSSWEAIGWEASTDDQKRYGVQHIGGFQVQYVPSLVGPIVELCFSVHEGLRKTAVKILQTMIVSEWTLNENLSVIETEIVDCLDHTSKLPRFAESIAQRPFVGELLDLFETLARIPGDRMWQAIKGLLSTMDELLGLLAAVHGPGLPEAVKIMHILQLMEVLKDKKKENVFIRYVHQLAEVQKNSCHDTEAGLALQLHANLYQWDYFSTVPALTDPSFPEQTSFERKEQLYFQMIKHFEEGGAWDCAMKSYKELSEQYEHHIFDYPKLARAQHSIARIYEDIAKGEEHSPRYFKVAYRGLGFPDSLRDKDFIFQANPNEKASSFADHLRLQHPAAQIALPGDIDDLEGQYLQVSSVTPYRDLKHPLFQQSKVAHGTRDFILQAQPRRFAVTTRRHSPATGVQNQWMEKTVYTTGDSFPTILGRSDIIAVDVVTFTPLQTAVERTTRKTSEMNALQKRINMEEDKTAFVTLTDHIRTSIDSTSLASVAQYRELLPAPAEAHGDDESGVREARLSPMQNALKHALLDHVWTIRQGLNLYSSRDWFADLHESLSRSFQATFAPELAMLAEMVPPSAPSSIFEQPSLSLPPSRGFSSETPRRRSLVNDITALPTLEENDNSGPPVGRSFSRLSLGLIRPLVRSNGSVGPQSSASRVMPESSASRVGPDEDSTSNRGRPAGANSASQSQDKSENQRPGSKSMQSPSSAVGESERPTTAQSGRSGRMKKRLSMLGIGKGSVKSKSGGGKGGVEAVQEEDQGG
ncbi:MAG: hypothetical protein LQ350_001947 [Teloschistes chrysophthalmus]|nr:MAG: hypothetical protein LQ350_001947 [Niorma chrysophthalma]